MAEDRRRHLHRGPRAVAATVALCLLSISAVQPDTRDALPDHGLATSKDPGPASPSMADFFRPSSPAARNDSEDAAWSLAPPRPPPLTLPSGGNDKRRSTALVAVGVACGVLGLAAASLACLLRAKRSSGGPESGPASAPGSSRRRSGRDEVFYNERWI